MKRVRAIQVVVLFFCLFLAPARAAVDEPYGIQSEFA
jgi:hypothetical protein